MSSGDDDAALQELLNRIRRGDTEAADVFLGRAIDRLRRTARRILNRFDALRREWETDDVVSQVFLRMKRSLVDKDKSTPATPNDFFSITGYHIRMELLDLLRKQQRGGRRVPIANGPDESGVPASGIPDDTTCTPEKASRSELRQRLYEEIGRLPGELQEVFDQHHCLELSFAEIAKNLKISKETVRLRWLSTLQKLRRKLGDNFGLDA